MKSGERTLPVRQSDGLVPRRACSRRQLADDIIDLATELAMKSFSASCRKEQAGCLCSPDYLVRRQL
jgi:hypothetical protein